jgi:hypothetical protein
MKLPRFHTAWVIHIGSGLSAFDAVDGSSTGT